MSSNFHFLLCKAELKILCKTVVTIIIRTLKFEHFSMNISHYSASKTTGSCHHLSCPLSKQSKLFSSRPFQKSGEGQKRNSDKTGLLLCLYLKNDRWNLYLTLNPTPLFIFYFILRWNRHHGKLRTQLPAYISQILFFLLCDLRQLLPSLHFWVSSYVNL